MCGLWAKGCISVYVARAARPRSPSPQSATDGSTNQQPPVELCIAVIIYYNRPVGNGSARNVAGLQALVAAKRSQSKRQLRELYLFHKSVGADPWERKVGGYAEQ